MDSFDWLEQLHREAWTARIRQMRPQLREERTQVQAQFLAPHPVEQSSSPRSPTTNSTIPLSDIIAIAANKCNFCGSRSYGS
ncbi:hypothetical protein [Chroococcidiopsis cubana]|uniref:hypothetical protein n=1 Tax=Chroococcidiopsis cubana TaxID=171392 RepID=UPI000F8EF219|nr:hypothetical protein [Chroococcidiopsis cubana]